MKIKEFNPNELNLVIAWEKSITKACKSLNFDCRCLDWFSYTPDIYIKQKNLVSNKLEEL